MVDLAQGVQTLRWKDGALEMIDQRVLPAQFGYLRYESAASVAEGIRTMVVRGAPAIGVAAAYGVALEAIRLKALQRQEFNDSLEAGFDALAASRPTAVNLFWALKRMRVAWNCCSELGPQEVAVKLLEEALLIHEQDVLINRELGRYGAELLADGARVLTHCNAGALATAGHGTALGVLRSAKAAGKNLSVIAGETRPFLQGARLTAWELLQDGFDVTLITDNMAGHMMATNQIDVVIVGTDRVAANGDVVNKIGTYTVAVLARRHNIPFYVACPLSSVDMSVVSGDDIPIEERDPLEVTGFRGAQWAAKGVKVRNPSFDVTPAELVTALITEKGAIHSPNTAKMYEFLNSKR
jgi:methylthioribose-1-phosphate isomerase